MTTVRPQTEAALVLEAHQVSVGVMASPNHELYGKGYFADCTCGWLSPGVGEATKAERAAADARHNPHDPYRRKALRLGHAHLLDELLKVIP